MTRLPHIAILLSALSVAACVPVRPISQTNKAADYTSHPQSLVFVPAIAGSLPGDQVNLFETDFLASLRACGLTMTAVPVSEAPNPYVIAAATRGNGAGANADSVLIVQTAQKGTSSGGQIAVGYALTLDDLVSKKTVWKAIIDAQWDPLLSDHSALGRDLSAAAIASMRKDSLIPERCASAQ